MRYTKKDSWLRYAVPSTVIAVLGGLIPLLTACGINCIKFGIAPMAEKYPVFEKLITMLSGFSDILLMVTLTAVALAIIVHAVSSDSAKICMMVKRGLFKYENGNPLHLQEGQRLPKVTCRETASGVFELAISAITATVDEICGISQNISSSINGKRYRQYAVTGTDTDVACNEVRFTIEDVTIHKELTISSVRELYPRKATKLIVQKGTYIDLTTSGSMLFCGKTRSGKTTGVIAVLLQILSAGRDRYGSEVIIIDPKQAELSRLPHVHTLDEDGEARGILQVIRDFTKTIKERQGILNRLSEEKGDAVHWWEADMHASVLFIDEYVAVRTMFPKRAGKDDSDYCLTTFDALIRQIVTMGASAGCYVIISIAEASVDEGGLPSMIRSAMSTKVLFKPTVEEGRFLWNSEKMKVFPERVYNAGDAWFSSTDGVHDRVTFVHFPILDFPVYRELGRLLKEYYTEV